MRAIAMIAVLGLALGWSSGAFSESALSGSASKTLAAPNVKQLKSSTSLRQQGQELSGAKMHSQKLLSGAKMHSQKLTAVKTEALSKTYQKADTKARKRVDAKFSNLASSSNEQQQPNVLSANKLSVRDLSSATGLNKNEQKGLANKVMNKLR